MSPVKTHSQCTISRTYKVTHGTMSMAGGKSTTGRTVTETGPCRTPLFLDGEIAVGICESCARGWAVKDNTFANVRERKRAVQAARRIREGR